MKNILLILVSMLVLLSSTCKKEGEDCHKVITIINNSSDTIIFATKSYYYNNSLYTLCKLEGLELIPNESYEESLLRMCWEDELEQRNYEFFIVDPLSFNEGGFYDCDSIEYKILFLNITIYQKMTWKC
jgi:hypothetical protein